MVSSGLEVYECSGWDSSMSCFVFVVIVLGGGGRVINEVSGGQVGRLNGSAGLHVAL
jgi:hypothetical protein